MYPSATSARRALPGDDGWAIFALPPGERDLARPEYWEVSQERSRRRREARTRPRIARGPASRVSLALAAVSIGAPAAIGATGADRAVAATSSSTSASLALKRGSTGPMVRALQARLGGISVDGIFGPQTERAVKAFQRANGIAADGYVGPLTTRALGDLQSGTTRAASVSANVRIAMDASLARAMQAKLGVAVDGVVGPQTIAAVRAFQAKNGLEVDGVPGPITLRALGLSGSASSSTTTTTTAQTVSQVTSAPSTSSRATSAVSAAMSKIGTPYRWGATGPSSFDCSGLVQWAMGQAGISLPRTSYAMYGVGSPVPSNQIRAGDLVFFNTAGSGASHLGIATSPTTAVSATTHGVMVHDIRSGYWGSHFLGARRVA
jgi:cell wall-associated NlpC family hydrolase